MSERSVRINLDARGVGEIVVDGVDMASGLVGVEISSRVGSLPQVALYRSAADDIRFEGLAEVVIARETLDPGPAAAVFLGAIDPEILQNAALNRMDLDAGPYSGTEAILRTLREWAEGRQTGG